MKPKTTRRINSSTDPATEYAKAVVSGEVIAGPHVRDACSRHLKDLKTGKKRGLCWDIAAADYAYGFFRTVLRLSEGQFEGIPFELHPSQKFIVGSLFGWKRKTGVRRFRRAYIEEGKGNGKSPMVGGIGLLGLTGDGEAGAQIYSAGADMIQANILFQDAVKMVDKSPALLRRIHQSGRNPVWNLADLKTGSFFRPVSRETRKTGSGPRPHMALCDEIHEHPDGGVIETLERGFKFRRQPLLVMITNSGSDRKSICWGERKHAVEVASGERDDDTTFSYVCALDEGDEPFDDPSCWEKANPLLGDVITEEYLAINVKQARDIPAKANGVRRLHFCQWTDAQTAWISQAAWGACEDESLCLDDFEGQSCFGGLDLSALKDLSAKALVFPDGFTSGGDPKFAAFVHGYTPAETLSARMESDNAPYDKWVEQGFVTAAPGKKIRLDYIAADAVRDDDRFGLEMLAYDQFIIDRFEDEVDALGAELPLVYHPQGWNKARDGGSNPKFEDVRLWMPGSIDMLETLILERRIRFHVNPALRSAVASATFDTSAAELHRFTKAKSTARIDMAVALAMAVGAATARDRVEPLISIYSRPELWKSEGDDANA